MRESYIQKAVVDWAVAKGMVARKLDFGQGWPDYLFLYSGLCFFIEFKAPGEQPTLLQKHVHKNMLTVGHEVFVIDDPAKGVRLIEDVLHGVRTYTYFEVARLRPGAYRD